MSQPAAQPNPYAAPKAPVQDADGPGGPAPALWNPNAAANWSLLFTPAFGAYLHMANWRAIGDPARAKSSKTWFVVALVLLVLIVLIGAVAPETQAADIASRGIGFGYLLAWYGISARPQAKYVKERWGKDYPRRGWGKPLMIAIVAYAAFIVVAIAVAYLALRAQSVR
ncbi:MAG TPA: hypothetical protein VFV84_10905 [Burkholderiales bacterium]|nr:hypothetical protein [Burkholderiales bacterium]